MSILMQTAGPSSINQVFEQAIQYQQTGQTEPAKQLYIRILDQQPNHIPALRNLAIIAWQSGDPELAAKLLERALSLDPERADLHAYLALVLDTAGIPERADSEYRAALKLDPKCVDALYNYGNALTAQGRLVEAIGHFQQVLDLQPNHPHARNNLGKAYLSSRQLEEAAACFRQVIAEQPGSFAAFVNLACVFRRQEDYDNAEANLRKAIELAPDHPYPRGNLGSILMAKQRFSDAIASFEEAVRIAPGNAQLQVCLAGAYGRQGRTEEALRCYQRALALDPGLVVAHQSWLFMLHCGPGLDPQELAGEHRKWDQRHAAGLFEPGRRHANKPDPERRLRVGYVSPDLHQHPVSFFLSAVLAAHDRNQIETFCYASGRVDAWTERLRSQAELWRTTDAIADSDLARLIEQDGIDILVDLSGHTARNRLLVFARKPAPVQVSWLGYFDTTGMRAMDYLIVDPHIAPPEEEAPYAEEPLRLEGCFLAYSVPDHAPAVAPPPCLERGFVTYGCFNALWKIGLDLISVWAQILRRNPSSRVVMKNPSFADEPTRMLYRRHFERCGIGAERLDLLEPSSHQDLFSFYSQMDVALDTFPYNGGTTTCEALGMGVPVIALHGDRFVGRIGSTLLRNAGLSDLLAFSQAEYVDKAVELGKNQSLLVDLRTNMRNRLAASPLCDTEGFTRRLESAYRNIWRRWCSTQQRI